MVIFLLASGRKMQLRASAATTIEEARQLIEETGAMIFSTDRELKSGRAARAIVVSLLGAGSRAMEYMIGPTAAFMRANGKTTPSMDMATMLGRMVVNSVECGRAPSSMAAAN